MENELSRKRAELSGDAVRVLNARTLASSHRRLAELVRPGHSVLDVGCGTGAITRGIAELAGPDGRVVGADTNAELIRQAREMHSQVPGLSFAKRDVFDLGFRGEFAIVTSSRVLQCVAQPGAALSEMREAAEPGGLVLVLDYNHEKLRLEPEPPASMQAFYGAFLRWRAEAGMDNAIADRLPALFRETGLKDIEVTPELERTERGDPDFAARIGIWAEVAASRGRQMVRDGYLTEPEREMAEREYREWVKETAVSQTMYLLAVQGRRPEEETADGEAGLACP
ncbi:hypothetical protein J31TS4_26890 [Paenibacillus sp. J31TS4]|uniref:methyltransferase domain-containing protein n=1 Tax=Paenibacillus sp. J31TS4 TaxID=2807195 RepID=UPI001B22B65A|nr:methyltransferase domain-containing protein [Paenibacillus sp. J31TS4]GIP39409.1 hypothetical protein J31TS4_26890 [Paenibacillus sp. J31TS4]